MAPNEEQSPAERGEAGMEHTIQPGGPKGYVEPREREQSDHRDAGQLQSEALNEAEEEAEEERENEREQTAKPRRQNEQSARS